MRVLRTLAFLFVAFFLSLGASAEEQQHEHPAGDVERLGQVHFPISCDAAAQKQFERAVAMLHSFWYEETRKAFGGVTQTDPHCAMGYWGIAMSLYRQLWEPPNAATLKEGWAAVGQAKAAGTKTARENAYIAAIEVFYKDADKLDHRTRALAYSKAMEQVYLHYPEDREAAVFYALTLIGTALATDKTYTNQKKAGAILEKVFAEQPDHPGVAHYIIHADDYPPLAAQALAAARRYAKIAPSVPHALHMPSHIFTRLGLWQESIQSNRAAAAAAKEYAIRSHLPGAWDQQLHAMDYLLYAYLQSGQDVAATRVLNELSAIPSSQPENLTSAYAFAAIPARHAVERRRWAEAASLALHPSTFPWTRYPEAEANLHFARALGAARSGNPGRAREEVEKLQVLRDALIGAKKNYWGDQVEIQRRAAAAWLAHAEGRNNEARKLMRSAAELEDSTEKDNVTPGPIVPSHELLGDLLLDLDEPAQALSEFETSLRGSPNRFNGLYGAARAAEGMGDREKAQSFYAQLAAICQQADGERPELQRAKAFLAAKKQ